MKREGKSFCAHCRSVLPIEQMCSNGRNAPKYCLECQVKRVTDFNSRKLLTHALAECCPLLQAKVNEHITAWCQSEEGELSW